MTQIEAFRGVCLIVDSDYSITVETVARYFATVARNN